MTESVSPIGHGQSGGLIHHLNNRTEPETPRSNFEWLHYCIRHEGIEDLLCQQLGLPKFIAKAMVDEETRSRVIVRDEGIMVLFKAMHQHDGSNPEMMVSLRLWLQQNRIVSTRQQDIDAVLTLKQEIEAGEGPASTADFLIDLIGHVYDEFDPLIGEMERELDLIEDLANREETEAVCGRLATLERRAAIFVRHLAPQTAIFEQIAASRSLLIDDEDKDHLRELGSRLSGMLEVLREYRDRAQIVDQRINRIEEFRQTKVNLLFAVAATLFLPATFLTGLFGVNVGGIPWLDSPSGFMIISGICVAMVAASYVLIRSKRLM